ncbi:MAG TPA: Crp/Fnr family transcriptional regulator [Panacibacter sp.]|nr:Crp/Fnr family transcriptional regulator [Panacibacter sp.]
MLNDFFNKLSKNILLTEADKVIFSQHVVVKKLRKRQYLLHEGEICKHVAFVNSGMLRSYLVDEKSNEHIIQFAPEGWFISDLYSFITEDASNLNIEAIESSELVLVSRASHIYLEKAVPEFFKFNYLQYRGAYIALQKRLTSTFTLSAEEKYINLLNIYPDIMQRVPQHMIASYLGLTAETLSRVRKKLTKKKSEHS